MPQKTDSYSTTLGSSIDTRKIISQIKEAVVYDDLDTQRENTLGLKPYGGFHPLFITGTYPSENTIPSFPHPISIKGIRGKNFICTDLRMVLRENKGGVFGDRIKNQQEYSFMMQRHKLTTLWCGGLATEFRTGLRFGAYSFGVWLGNAVTHLKSLNPNQQIIAQAVFCCYYNDLTRETDDFEDPLYRQSMIPWVLAMFKGQEATVENVVMKIGKEPIRTLDDAVDRLKKVLDTPLLANFTVSSLTTAIKSHWWGHGVNPQLLIGVAVEDPPTWCALVLSALQYTGYKNSQIAQTVLKLGKRGEPDAFKASALDLFRTKTDDEDSIRFEEFHTENSLISPENDNAMKYDNTGLIMRLEKTPDFGEA